MRPWPPLSAAQQSEVRRILERAGFRDESIEWMVASCPDVETAERFYGERRNPYETPSKGFKEE